MNPHVKQKSWKRRTDLNTFGYFGFLIALSVLTFWYTHYANTNAISDDNETIVALKVRSNNYDVD